MLFREKILRIHIKWEKGSQWSTYSCMLCALVCKTGMGSHTHLHSIRKPWRAVESALTGWVSASFAYSWGLIPALDQEAVVPAC